MVETPLPPPVPLPGPVLDGRARPPATFRVIGDIDIGTGPSISEGVRVAVEEGARDVAIDLAGATFVDSAGLVALLEARAAAAAGGARLVLLQPSESVRQLLWLTGLLGSFEFG